MILRFVSWSILLCLAFRTKAQIHVDENGYQNVLISFAPNVPSENGRQLIKNVQELLESTSNVLHEAIGIRIASAAFLLPPSWSTDTWEDITITSASSAQTERKPDIVLDATQQSPFGKQPVALQYGGCGVPGHQITLPLDFLGSTSYPKDKLLAREWLKYQYGVFEENGFKYDDLYPDYYRIPGSSDIKITECTNSEVKYTFKKPSSGEECTIMDSNSEFGYCRPHPDEESAANVTSSLMYFHQELQNMEHICGKDGEPHHNTTLSKHNVLCNGRSIWDVVQLSKDVSIPQDPVDQAPETIEFQYIFSKPKFVVLVDASENLDEQKTPINSALRRFYFDLPLRNKLAIYKFDSAVTDVLTYGELTGEKRNELSGLPSFDSSSENVCVSCALEKAVKTLLEDSEEGKRSILLITGSSLEKVPNLPADLNTTGISLSIMRFGLKEAIDESYENLSGTFSSFEYSSESIDLEELASLKSLLRFLNKPVPQFENGFEIKTVAYAMMSPKDSVTIPQNERASFYTLWLGRPFQSSGIKCKVGEDDVPLEDDTETSFTFKPVNGDVTCTLASTKQNPVLTQVQMTTPKGNYFSFDVWIHDASTDTEQLPIIIYAKIYFGGNPVKDASVTASITMENKPEEIVKMLDNGAGDPDITRYDGVYSGYFVGFESAGEYQITVQINDNEAQAKIGKEYPDLMSSTCCGSKVVSESEEIPAFQMEKTIKYLAKNKMPEEGYPPSRILDLRVGIYNSSNFVLLTWTAPGGGKASTYEFYAFCDLEDCEDGRLPNWLNLNQTELKPSPFGESQEVVIWFSTDIPQTENLTLFFAIKSASEKGKLSGLSNKAEILLSFSSELLTTTTTAPITNDDRNLAASDTTGIIVGSVLVGVFLLLCMGALFYFYVFKPRRAKPSDTDVNGYFQDKNKDGSELSGSFRAVPLRDRGSMRRVESFPVLLYTHDQLKDFKKKVDPPLYKPAIVPRPWMSMNVLSNSDQNRVNDSKSIGSASTLPMNEKHRSTEIQQLDNVSIASETPHTAETIKV